MIVLLAGLPGTGKSTLAGELATRTAGRIISKDEIRHAIFSEDEIEYSIWQDDLCLQIMLQTARFLLDKNRERIIFLDGRTFSRRYQIENVVAAIEAMHQPWKILECTCDDVTVKQRLELQSLDGSHPAGNRDFELYREMKSNFQVITHRKTVIDTAQPLETCVQQGLAALE